MEAYTEGKEKILGLNFREALETYFLDYGDENLTGTRKEILDAVIEGLQKDQTDDYLSSTGGSYNLMAISCFDENDERIRSTRSDVQFALLNDSIRPYVREVTLEDGSQVDCLDMRISFKAINAYR